MRLTRFWLQVSSYEFRSISTPEEIISGYSRAIPDRGIRSSERMRIGTAASGVKSCAVRRGILSEERMRIETCRTRPSCS